MSLVNRGNSSRRVSDISDQIVCSTESSGGKATSSGSGGRVASSGRSSRVTSCGSKGGGVITNRSSGRVVSSTICIDRIVCSTGSTG